MESLTETTICKLEQIGIPKEEQKAKHTKYKEQDYIILVVIPSP